MLVTRASTRSTATLLTVAAVQQAVQVGRERPPDVASLLRKTGTTEQLVKQFARRILTAQTHESSPAYA